ncbi:TPA: glycosyltransferase family 8 protein, partial [Mannheimia haemolytica]|nr:glycosyltransferase family 8 protein [Mannheimia haemolytica]
MTQKRKNIALAADYRVESQLICTIKSICYHNRDIEFYLFNLDFPHEWFSALNDQLVKLGCNIRDIKVDVGELKEFPTFQHIQSEATFYRYFIADVVESHKVLYLDYDLVVNGSLEPYFDLELGEKYIAASVDNLGIHIGGRGKCFNAGVMVINVDLWKKHRISRQALSLSKEIIHKVPDADQSILNILFKDRWLELENNFNYLVGAEVYYINNELTELISRKE